MKKFILIIVLLSFLDNYAQSESEKKKINKIEKEILNKNIKKETFQESDSGTIIIYLKGNIPILIEKQTAKFLHTYNFIENKRIERDIQTFINAKFYIQNWRKNDYIRVGKIIKIEAKSNSTVIMPIDYVFDYNKVEVEKKIEETIKQRRPK